MESHRNIKCYYDMNTMKSLLCILLVGASLSACSTDSPPAVNPNPLTLLLLDGKKPGNVGLFTLQVWRYEKPLKGAGLNMRTIPQGTTTRLQNVASDSSGIFKFTVHWDDSTLGVQFTAALDSMLASGNDTTLKSNVVSWP